jgi:hypothetical protein
VSWPTTLLSSSVVERSAVNRLVVGSNPTSGATLPSLRSKPRFGRSLTLPRVTPMPDSLILRTSALKAFVERVYRAKGQLCGSIHVCNARL